MQVPREEVIATRRNKERREAGPAAARGEGSTEAARTVCPSQEAQKGLEVSKRSAEAGRATENVAGR